ncbi:hypothetical protein F4808DRAFT_441710 [Astrocystis sublimbata]|nr:hypothetical protein F4808DRAFT_441710 [Astrocystis sublimbata]
MAAELSIIYRELDNTIKEVQATQIKINSLSHMPQTEALALQTKLLKKFGTVHDSIGEINKSVEAAAEAIRSQSGMTQIQSEVTVLRSEIRALILNTAALISNSVANAATLDPIANKKIFPLVNTTTGKVIESFPKTAPEIDLLDDATANDILAQLGHPTDSPGATLSLTNDILSERNYPPDTPMGSLKDKIFRIKFLAGIRDTVSLLEIGRP